VARGGRGGRGGRACPWSSEGLACPSGPSRVEWPRCPCLRWPELPWPRWGRAVVAEAVVAEVVELRPRWSSWPGRGRGGRGGRVARVCGRGGPAGRGGRAARGPGQLGAGVGEWRPGTRGGRTGALRTTYTGARGAAGAQGPGLRSRAAGSRVWLCRPARAARGGPAPARQLAVSRWRACTRGGHLVRGQTPARGKVPALGRWVTRAARGVVSLWDGAQPGRCWPEGHSTASLLPAPLWR